MQPGDNLDQYHGLILARGNGISHKALIKTYESAVSFKTDFRKSLDPETKGWYPFWMNCCAVISGER